MLRHLLLSKEARGKDRGFISYAELGINQLGAVYEGLMSYTGFFAETDLYEVAKDGDASKGSWVVPVERADGIAEKRLRPRRGRDHRRAQGGRCTSGARSSSGSRAGSGSSRRRTTRPRC